MNNKILKNLNGQKLYPRTNYHKNPSFVWQHGGFRKNKVTGELIKEHIFCSYCDTKLVYRGCPGNFATHLKTKHSDEIYSKTRNSFKLNQPRESKRKQGKLVKDEGSGKFLPGEIICRHCEKNISYTKCAKTELNKHLTAHHMSEYLETSEPYNIEKIENSALEKCLNWNGFRLYPPPNQSYRSSLSRSWEHGGFFKDKITGKLLTRYTICSQCGSKLSYHGSPNNLQKHMIMLHGVPNEDFEKKALQFIGCSDCDKIFETKTVFQDHKCSGEFQTSGEETSNPIITCPFCPYFKQKDSKNFKSLLAHLYHKHKALSKTENYQSLANEMKQLTKETCFCVECDKILQCRDSYKAHLKAYHDPKIFKCDLCRKLFSTLTRLKQHKYTHNERTVPCYQCGNLFKTERKMREHIRRNHTKRKYCCEICSKRFRTIQLLEKHRRAVHEKLKPFNCELCEFRCAAFNNLNLHRTKSHRCSPLRPTDYKDLVRSGKHPFVFSFPSLF